MPMMAKDVFMRGSYGPARLLPSSRTAEGPCGRTIRLRARI